MANRNFYSEQFNSDAGTVDIFVVVAFNGSGTPSLLVCDLATGKYTVAPSAGTAYVKSFVRNGTGDYTITLKDPFVRLLGYNVSFISNANTAAPLCQVKVASDPTNAQAFGTNVGAGAVRGLTPTVELLTFSSQGTAADPGAAELATIKLELQNSIASTKTS